MFAQGPTIDKKFQKWGNLLSVVRQRPIYRLSPILQRLPTTVGWDELPLAAFAPPHPLTMLTACKPSDFGPFWPKSALFFVPFCFLYSIIALVTAKWHTYLFPLDPTDEYRCPFPPPRIPRTTEQSRVLLFHHGRFK